MWNQPVTSTRIVTSAMQDRWLVRKRAGDRDFLAFAGRGLRWPILLADEPTGRLESEAGRLVLELLDERQRSRSLTLVLTHDPAVAARGDRIVHMLDGRALEIASADAA